MLCCLVKFCDLCKLNDAKALNPTRQYPIQQTINILVLKTRIITLSSLHSISKKTSPSTDSESTDHRPPPRPCTSSWSPSSSWPDPSDPRANDRAPKTENAVPVCCHLFGLRYLQLAERSA